MPNQLQTSELENILANKLADVRTWISEGYPPLDKLVVLASIDEALSHWHKANGD